MSKDWLRNGKRFLAMLLAVLLIGSGLQPARDVFATDGSGAVVEVYDVEFVNMGTMKTFASSAGFFSLSKM